MGECERERVRERYLERVGEIVWLEWAAMDRAGDSARAGEAKWPGALGALLVSSAGRNLPASSRRCWLRVLMGGFCF